MPVAFARGGSRSAVFQGFGMKSVVFTLALLSFFGAATVPAVWATTPTQTKATLDKATPESPLAEPNRGRKGCSKGICTGSNAPK